MKGVIYRITSPTGKVYIGQTVNLERRITCYRTYHCKSQRALYNSLKYHGWEFHRLDILEEVYRDNYDELISVLNNREIEYIRLYNSYKDGLNCDEGGRSAKKSEETKLRISKSQKGKSTRRGKNHSEETKNKIRIALLGKKHTEDRRRNESNSHLGKPSLRKGKTYKSQAIT